MTKLRVLVCCIFLPLQITLLSCVLAFFKNTPIPIYYFLCMFLLLLIIIFEYNHISFAWFVFLTFYWRDFLWLWPFFSFLDWMNELKKRRKKHFLNGFWLQQHMQVFIFVSQLGNFVLWAIIMMFFVYTLLYPTLNYFEV